MLGLAYFVPMIALCLPVAWRSTGPTHPPGPTHPVDRRGGDDPLPGHCRALHHQGHLPVVLVGAHVTFILFVIIVTASPVVLAPEYGASRPRGTTSPTKGRSRIRRRRPRDRRRVGRARADRRTMSDGPDRPGESDQPTDDPRQPHRPLRLGRGGGHPGRRGRPGRLRPDRPPDSPGVVHRAPTSGAWSPSSPKFPARSSTPSASTRRRLPWCCPPCSTASPRSSATGKPEVLYVGAEFCPFCGAERWPLIVALSRFGHFTTLTNMQSAQALGVPRHPDLQLRGADLLQPVCHLHRRRAVLRRRQRPGRLHPDRHAHRRPVGPAGPLRRHRRATGRGPGAYPFVDIGNADGHLDLGVQPGGDRGSVTVGHRRRTSTSPPTRSARPSWPRPTT